MAAKKDKNALAAMFADMEQPEPDAPELVQATGNPEPEGPQKTDSLPEPPQKTEAPQDPPADKAANKPQKAVGDKPGAAQRRAKKQPASAEPAAPPPAAPPSEPDAPADAGSVGDIAAVFRDIEDSLVNKGPSKTLDRVTFLLKSDYHQRLDALCKNKPRGFKTNLFNTAVRMIIEQYEKGNS